VSHELKKSLVTFDNINILISKIDAVYYYYHYFFNGTQQSNIGPWASVLHVSRYAMFYRGVDGPSPNPEPGGPVLPICEPRREGGPMF
jgi:hypothetical protein